ncbi:MAG: hypothetical protein JWS10_459 [Cypionkella sp.]|uniref:hypothetical protein n=1 Tax=Cypionkella sp. TaxID=2811411 RepID=UPI0026196BF8|nr:hypothetical protein [Cypionkella sp.]MDB5657844.1 hypothetical protein [Cypionkella sp.]
MFKISCTLEHADRHPQTRAEFAKGGMSQNLGDSIDGGILQIAPRTLAPNELYQFRDAEMAQPDRRATTEQWFGTGLQ